jgi:transposase
VSEHAGKVSERHRLSRKQFSRFLAERAPATVVMEACGTAHELCRQADARGHRVVLLPPHTVRPYVQRNKTDGADAKGLLEALRNEAITHSRGSRPRRACQRASTSMRWLARSGW